MEYTKSFICAVLCALASGIIFFALIQQVPETIWLWSDTSQTLVQRLIRTILIWCESGVAAIALFSVGEALLYVMKLRKPGLISFAIRACGAALLWQGLCATYNLSVISGAISGGVLGESVAAWIELIGIPYLAIWAGGITLLYVPPLIRFWKVPAKPVVAARTVEPRAKPAMREKSPKNVDVPAHAYVLPAKNLLETAGSLTRDDRDERNDLEKKSKLLEEKLAHFGIKGRVVSAISGPVVTVFEYKPAQDVKVSRVLACEDDIALALQAISVRCRAPMPGKAVIGFEVAYAQRKPVLLGDVVSQGMRKDTVLPLALGVDIVGRPIVLDLRTVPHLLVAGATGSGKSVALSSMLVSLLMSRTPDELKLILIDPKRLEFSLYADIPHLLFPHITEPGEAVEALSWLVGEMERRYKKLAEAGARSLEEYRALTGDMLPYIVVCIDELADLMMTAARDVEHYLIRLAQMARAAGIHLIVATQRPSVDVITGIIKANFPTRIAFRVVSKIDSRTILDAQGAEKLVGKGDLLMLDSAGMVTRAHGAYISTQEIGVIVAAAKAQRPPHYIERTMRVGEAMGPDDDMIREVEKILVDRTEISISEIQRRLRIGYNRAARIMEELELKGRVLTTPGSKMKRVVR